MINHQKNLPAREEEKSILESTQTAFHENSSLPGEIFNLDTPYGLLITFLTNSIINNNNSTVLYYIITFTLVFKYPIFQSYLLWFEYLFLHTKEIKTHYVRTNYTNQKFQ